MGFINGKRSNVAANLLDAYNAINLAEQILKFKTYSRFFNFSLSPFFKTKILFL